MELDAGNWYQAGLQAAQTAALEADQRLYLQSCGEKLQAAQHAASIAQARLQLQEVAVNAQREVLERARAELKGLRHELAVAPQPKVHSARGDGQGHGQLAINAPGIDAFERAQMQEAVLEILDLRAELHRRPPKEKVDYLREQLQSLQAELGKQGEQEHLQAEVLQLQGEIGMRPSAQEHQRLQCEAQQMQADLESRPSAQEHWGLMQEVGALQEQLALLMQSASGGADEAGRAREVEAGLKSELREVVRAAEMLRKGNMNVATEVAENKAQVAADWAKWMSQLAAVRHNEVLLQADLRNARGELEVLRKGGRPDSPQGLNRPASSPSAGFPGGAGGPRPQEQQAPLVAHRSVPPSWRSLPIDLGVRQPTPRHAPSEVAGLSSVSASFFPRSDHRLLHSARLDARDQLSSARGAVPHTSSLRSPRMDVPEHPGVSFRLQPRDDHVQEYGGLQSTPRPETRDLPQSHAWAPAHGSSPAASPLDARHGALSARGYVSGYASLRSPRLDTHGALPARTPVPAHSSVQLTGHSGYMLVPMNPGSVF